ARATVLSDERAYQAHSGLRLHHGADSVGSRRSTGLFAVLLTASQEVWRWPIEDAESCAPAAGESRDSPSPSDPLALVEARSVVAGHPSIWLLTRRRQREARNRPLLLRGRHSTEGFATGTWKFFSVDLNVGVASSVTRGRIAQRSYWAGRWNTHHRSPSHSSGRSAAAGWRERINLASRWTPRRRRPSMMSGETGAPSTSAWSGTSTVKSGAGCRRGRCSRR